MTHPTPIKYNPDKPDGKPLNWLHIEGWTIAELSAEMQRATGLSVPHKRITSWEVTTGHRMHRRCVKCERKLSFASFLLDDERSISRKCGLCRRNDQPKNLIVLEGDAFIATRPFGICRQRGSRA